MGVGFDRESLGASTSGVATSSVTTDVEVLSSATGTQLWVTDVVISNASTAVGLEVDLRDASTIRATFPAPAGGANGVGGSIHAFHTPIPMAVDEPVNIRLSDTNAPGVTVTVSAIRGGRFVR